VAVRQYIYLDTEGLAAFNEQLDSPQVREKTAKLTVQFGMTPISATQDETLRDATDHEKVQRLLAVLSKKSLKRTRLAGREAFNHAEASFRLETCRARNIFLPRASADEIVKKDDFVAEELFGQPVRPMAGFLGSSERESPMRRAAERAWRKRVEEVRSELASFPGIGLWWSEFPSDANHAEGGHLFLIQNFRRDKTAGFSASSALTALTALFADMGVELRRTVLHAIEGREIDPSTPTSLKDSFLRDPAGWFRRFGARVGPDRQITTLYNVREAVLYRDARTGKEEIATVAYPIFIAAGTG